jgi:hypothetical protein
MLENVEQLDYHHSIAERQRESYKLMKNNLKKDQILIEIDWKQKILIGNYKK